MKNKKFNHNNFLLISEVKDNTVILKDGSVCCVIAIKPLNAGRVTPERRLRLMAYYRQWLESLTYPVQIVGRTVNADLKEQIGIFRSTVEHEIKQKAEYKDTLKNFREFADWLAKHAEEYCVANRIYYLVIPHRPAYASKSEIKKRIYYTKSLEILDKRTEEAKRLLKKAGLKLIRLSSLDIEHLYSSYFNLFLQSNKGKPSAYRPSTKWLEMWKMEA